MLFNSYEFIFIFLPITLLIYFFLASFKLPKLATISLVIASLAFYSYWNIKYLPLLLVSITFNYIMGSYIERLRSKKLLWFAIGINLFLLAYFKYTGFLIQSYNQVLGASIFIPMIVLPLGISFFTFTQTAYLVDAYRGETQKYSFLEYCLFVTVFPHLIAGPILHHKEIIPQFSKLKNFTFSHQNMAIGLSLFSIGLFKKVVIADTLSPWVDLIFGNVNQINFIEAWVGAIAYTFQLYFDFSGYSEMAIGLAFMFNFVFPINFNSPYKATSIIDFWHRWHITLGLFLKNYIYIPLGGNRYGEVRKIRNLLITMLVGGLWHGAGWTFIVWGGLHGIYLIVNHLWRKTGFFMPQFLSWTITFMSVVVAWVFFRARNVHEAITILYTMVDIRKVVFPSFFDSSLLFLSKYGVVFGPTPYLKDGKQELVFLMILMIVVLLCKNPNQSFLNFNPTRKSALLMGLILVVVFLKLTQVSAFLYFQF